MDTWQLQLFEYGTVQPLKVSAPEVTWDSADFPPSIHSHPTKNPCRCWADTCQPGPCLKLLGLTRHQQTKNEEQQKNLEALELHEFHKGKFVLETKPWVAPPFQDWDSFFVKRKRSSTHVFFNTLYSSYICAMVNTCWYGGNGGFPGHLNPSTSDVVNSQYKKKCPEP